MGSPRCALLVVDVQEGLVAKKLYAKERFLATIREAVSRFREAGRSIVFIRHEGAGLAPGSPGWELYSGFDRRAGDPIVDKRRGNAFEGTPLAGMLAERGIGEILVCGLATNGCVRATCIGGAAIGLRVGLVRGGHSSWARDASARIERVERELAAAGIETIGLTGAAKE
jgi:nicotinamidase-related amidase